MGVVESKKDGVVRKFQLKVDLKAEVKNQLLDLTNWSFADIKQAYDIYCRMSDCPYIDFFIFHKIMPFTTEVSRHIYASYASGDQYINIFELVCVLILMSHNNYRRKLQLFFVIFDFRHLNRLTNRQLILVFESTINAFCRMTGQYKPKYQYLTRYTIERFIRANTLEALEKVVTYRRLIEEVQGNNDCFQLFKRFDEQIYGYFTQESYLFRVNQYKRYEKEDIEKIYRTIKKVNLDKNYEDVELVENNRRFRLENRKIECIKQLLEQKEQKFKKSSLGDLKTRSSSIVMSTSRLPSLQRSSMVVKESPNVKVNKMQTLTSMNSKNLHKTKVLILDGKSQCKEDIFETIRYFKSLSGNKNQIKPKQFTQSFEKKTFIKKQIGSLFHFFDIKNKGQVNFQDFLKAYYPNITKNQVKIIQQWLVQYRAIHEADQFDVTEQKKQKEKKAHVELPRNTLKRIDQIFSSIDRGQKGFLNFQDLKKAYNTGFTIKELEEMMRDFGKNNKIYKEEFIKMTLPEDWTIEGTQYVGV